MLDTEIVLSLFGVKREIWGEILYFALICSYSFPDYFSSFVTSFSFAIFSSVCVSSVVCLLASFVMFVPCFWLAQNCGLVILVLV